MNIEKDFLIPFVGLKLGKHHYDYHIKNEFINHFGYDDFEQIDVNVDLVLEKKSTLLELIFEHNGTVTVPCDVTGDTFNLPITGKLKLIVKFGDEFNDENEELLILPFSEYQVDIKQYIYELIVLSIPTRRIHPDHISENEDDEDLDLNDLDFLDNDDLDIFDSIDDFGDEDLEEEQEKQIDQHETIEDTKTIDPRWEKLKQLLTDK